MLKGSFGVASGVACSLFSVSSSSPSLSSCEGKRTLQSSPLAEGLQSFLKQHMRVLFHGAPICPGNSEINKQYTAYLVQKAHP